MDESQKEQAQKVFKAAPYINLIGFEMVDIEYGEVTLSLAMRNELKQVHGLLHGGATASLIDTATGFAVASVLGDGEKAATIDLTLHYLRPVTDGKITCVARVIKNGRRFLTLSAEVKNNNEELVATALSTYTRV